MSEMMFPGIGAGTGAGAAGASAEPTSTTPVVDVDLTDMIDHQGCYARNVSTAYPLRNLFIGDTTLGCKSDSDEQLIIHIAFKEFVRIRSIQVTEYNNGQDPECNPTKVSLYVNRENLGFEDIDDIDPTQVIDFGIDGILLKNDSEPVKLNYVKYQRVTSLTLYFDDNNGGDVTALGRIRIIGRLVETTNMKNFKKEQQQQA